MLKQQGYDPMGAALEVYNELGYGMAEAQWFNSMRIARKQVGYLINFGQKGELKTFTLLAAANDWNTNLR